MTDKIKEAAQALIEAWESESTDCRDMGLAVSNMKAALKPSKAEVADWMEARFSGCSEKDQLMLDNAIEYLRED